jgi:hypothetical protein
MLPDVARRSRHQRALKSVEGIALDEVTVACATGLQTGNQADHNRCSGRIRRRVGRTITVVKCKCPDPECWHADPRNLPPAGPSTDGEG